MGKLVLGIIAVTLLQFAFFAVVIKDRADYSTVGEIAAREGETALELARVNESPEVVVREKPPESAVASPERIRLKPSAATGRSASADKPRQTVSRRNRIVRNDARVAAVAPAKSEKFQGERIVVPKRAGTSIPRGYTMVLVDYPRAESGKHAREISKPKKRSYLARALPALVKKPWNWIKSIASKLD